MKELEQILDSGIANAYMLAYLAEALRRTDLSPEDAEKVRQGYLTALDLYTASEILPTSDLSERIEAAKSRIDKKEKIADRKEREK